MRTDRSPGRPPYDDLLTPAEWRVAEAVRHGLSNPTIAARLGVSVDAVKFHVGNALQKLGFSSRAELRRWDGVRRESPLTRRTKIMNVDVKLDFIGQISRTVSDIVAARRWYEEVVGLPHLYSFGNLAFFDCGGVRLFLSEGTAGPESILYFKVEDVHAAAATLAGRGAEINSAPHMIHKHGDGTEEWMAFFNDPDGRPLAIMSRQGAN
jgi:DNA-binding CsgD family transcriptional regulator/predicted enzyme related to lactoylglutathione lyase